MPPKKSKTERIQPPDSEHRNASKSQSLSQPIAFEEDGKNTQIEPLLIKFKGTNNEGSKVGGSKGQQQKGRSKLETTGGYIMLPILKNQSMLSFISRADPKSTEENLGPGPFELQA